MLFEGFALRATLPVEDHGLGHGLERARPRGECQPGEPVLLGARCDGVGDDVRREAACGEVTCRLEDADVGLHARDDDRAWLERRDGARSGGVVERAEVELLDGRHAHGRQALGERRERSA